MVLDGGTHFRLPRPGLWMPGEESGDGCVFTMGVLGFMEEVFVVFTGFNGFDAIVFDKVGVVVFTAGLGTDFVTAKKMNQ